MTVSLKKILLPLCIVALILLLGWQLSQKDHAPEVTFTTLEGKSIAMASLKGKVVLVNFWATDCPACIQEMPDLIQTYQKFHDRGFELIAVAMPYDPPAQVLNYTRINKLPFPVMHDGLGEMTHQFNDVTITPTAYIFDKQGRQLQHSIGVLDFVKLHQLLDKALN